MREPGPRAIDISRAKRAAAKQATQVFAPPRAGQAPAPAQSAPAPAQPAPAAPQQPAPQRPVLTTGDPTAPISLPQNHPALQGKRPAGPPAEQQAEQPAAKEKKKWTAGKVLMTVLASLMAVLLLVSGGAYLYVSRMFDPNTEGGGGQLTRPETVTPPELAESQVNFLVLGLDYLDDAVDRTEDTMMTDMILYCQFNKDDKTLKMLQVPRDTFVARPDQTDQTGKINALYSFGPDSENKVQNLVDVFYETFQLPVDYYVTIRMDALVEFVNTFGGGGGLEVYVPKDIYLYDENDRPVLDENGNHVHLESGYRTLRGEELEIFLRARKGPGMERSDFDRLVNQRYFYSALFRYVRTMSVSEMMRLMPVCVKYINTNMPMTTCVALGLQFLNGGVPDENIVMGRLPMYGNGIYYLDSALGVKPMVSLVAAQQAADFLNQYFRPADAPVDVGALDIRTCGDPASWGGVVEAELSHVGADGQVEAGASLPVSPDGPLSGDASAPADGASVPGGEPASGAAPAA